MFKDLAGKTALVTGSGKRTGIGFAIAEKLASNRANIIIADLGRPGTEDGGVRTASPGEMEEIAESLREEYGVRTMAVQVDVSRAESVEAMAAEIKKVFKRVDLLFNNAGATFGVPNAVHTYDEAAWIKTIDVSLHGVFRVTKAIVPLMAGGPGAIVNTSSRAAKFPPPFNGAYAVAKAGVNMMTKVLAKELAGLGIRVNAICPGQIMTDLEAWRFDLEAQVLGSTAADREKEMCKTIPLGRIGSPSEAAALAVFLASEESSYITGQTINVTGGQLMEL
ncbi:MAG: SDR family NAD(P)-dependent oxidoreductase [Pseudomonadota bacterium]